MGNKLVKKEIDVLDYFNEIIKGIKTGVLLTTKHNNKVNTMTISWGQVGIEWNKLIFTTYVRTGRYTHKMLLESGVFTINIGSRQKVGKILNFCGSKSGKSVDKVSALGLTVVKGNNIDVVGFKELPLTLECKVIYRQLQDENSISKSIKSRFYPHEVPSDYSGSNKDYHTMFYGEIVGAYLIEESDE
jgi:flavin reductase (DIM6/NTAB) family NADH-FMN oxidoreductase RutF